MVNLARVFAAEKNLSEAEKLYANALAADAKNFDALNGLTSIKTARGNFADAHASIDRAISENNQKEVLAALHYLKSNVCRGGKQRSGDRKRIKNRD